MKNAKTMVELRRYQDGMLTDVRTERRVVRSRKDGTLFVTGIGGSSPVHRDPVTGALYWEIRFSSVAWSMPKW